MLNQCDISSMGKLAVEVITVCLFVFRIYVKICNVRIYFRAYAIFNGIITLQ